MVNLTLLVNCISTLALATAVVLIQDLPLVSLGLAYASGLLTSFASRYDVRVSQDNGQ
jgi:O-antigen/teichoic acid export membrane protein